jgi:hypothetical protein
MTTLQTSTPFGIVTAEFSEQGGPAVTGPAAAVELLAERMRFTPDHRGMMSTLDSCDPIAYLHVTATCGFGIAPVAAGPDLFEVDPVAEFAAMPAIDDQDALDGDFPGHPFRGNQHRKASAESHTAVRASIRAKRAEGKGDKATQKKAHRSAYHSHSAAAEDATGAARKYHKTMAKFHKQRGGVLDTVDNTDEVLDKAEPIEVNAFREGDKVVCTDDSKDYIVTGQRGHQVSVKGKPEPLHANRLKLASGAKPARKVLDGVEAAAALDAVDHDWHRRTQEKFRGYDEAQLRFVIKDATEAEKLGRQMGTNAQKLGQYLDEISYASMELNRRKKGGKKGDTLDSVADEWPAELTEVLDGDFPGHPFRGNQHVEGDRSSADAGQRSRHAKSMEERHGVESEDTKHIHDFAADGHEEAHKKAPKGSKAAKYHETMAQFHRKRGMGAKRIVPRMDSVAEVPGLHRALQSMRDPMKRLGVMSQIMEARATPDENVSAPGISRPTPAALEVLALAQSSGQQRNAYRAAVAIQAAIEARGFRGLTVRWDAVDTSDVPAFDSTGDLFGGEAGPDKLLTCLVAYNGRTFATIYVRGDGQARLKAAGYIEGMDYGPSALEGVEALGLAGWVSGELDADALAEAIAGENDAEGRLELSDRGFAGVVAHNEDMMPDADEPGYSEAPKELTHAQRELAVIDALQDEGWDIRQMVASKDDGDAQTLIEAEYADADAVGGGITWSISKDDDSGASKAERVEDVPGNSPKAMADVLIMTANAMELVARLSAAEARAVAQTILQQLGGNKFVAMTGAKTFVNLNEGNGGVQFSLPTGLSAVNGKKTGINRVTIRLNGGDTYDVEFGAARASKTGPGYRVVASTDDIYADSLAEVFTRYTGLDTNLGSMGKRTEPTPEPAAPFDGVKAILAALVALGWSEGPYDGTVHQMFDYIGPTGTMVTPKGERRVIVSVRGDAVRATLGDDTIASVAVPAKAIETENQALALDIDVKAWAKAKQDANPGNPAKAKPVEQVGTFKYALVNRPAMVGGLPRGLMYQVQPRPAPGEPHHDMARHGILLAERELTEAELKNFELAELIEGPALDRVAAEVAAGMSKYAAQYIEQEQDEPAMFRSRVLDKAKRPDSGVMRSIASDDALVDRVLVLLEDAVKASDKPPRRSEQFLSYMKAINEGKASPGMLEQINMDTRLEDGEAEILIAAAKDVQPVVPEPAATVKDVPTTPAPATGDTVLSRLNALMQAAPKDREAVTSDDPRAIEKLQAKVDYLTANGDMMRQANKLVRKQDRAGLAAMGFSEKIIEGLFQKDFAGRIGFADYMMANNSGLLASTRKRLDALKAATMTEPMVQVDPKPEPAPVEVTPEPAPPADPARAQALDTLRQVVAGTHPRMAETAFVDEVIAILESRPDDAEIQAMADPVSEALANTALAATEGLAR